jgi:hypothetical protein
MLACVAHFTIQLEAFSQASSPCIALYGGKLKAGGLQLQPMLPHRTFSWSLSLHQFSNNHSIFSRGQDFESQIQEIWCQLFCLHWKRYSLSNENSWSSRCQKMKYCSRDCKLVVVVFGGTQCVILGTGPYLYILKYCEEPTRKQCKNWIKQARQISIYRYMYSHDPSSCSCSRESIMHAAEFYTT